MTKRYVTLTDENKAVGKVHTTPECQHLSRTDKIAEIEKEDLEGFETCKTCGEQ